MTGKGFFRRISTPLATILYADVSRVAVCIAIVALLTLTASCLVSESPFSNSRHLSRNFNLLGIYASILAPILDDIEMECGGATGREFWECIHRIGDRSHQFDENVEEALRTAQMGKVVRRFGEDIWGMPLVVVFDNRGVCWLVSSGPDRIPDTPSDNQYRFVGTLRDAWKTR